MQQRRWRWLRAAGWILQPRGRGLEFGRWGFGPLPSGKHRRRWRRLGGWRALGRGAPTVSTLPWSLGSIRRVRCFPNWGSRKARRHLGRWRPGGHWQPRWRALGWRGLRRGAPAVCTLPWSLGSIRKVRCFPWGSSRARRHPGKGRRVASDAEELDEPVGSRRITSERPNVSACEHGTAAIARTRPCPKR